jgi:hypothetical protein
MDEKQKSCSICGNNFPRSEFSYGNREDRSYCRACDKADKAARSVGGAEAARKFRDSERSKWQS